MSARTKEVVVVIGPGGIGRAIARRVGAGRTLLLAGHSEQETKDVAEQLRGDGYDTAEHPTDISDLAAVEALADKAAALGPVTRVIHAAGVSPTQASIERIVHVDLVGTAHVLDAFARVIAPGGAGIVVASMAGHRESPYDRDLAHALATTPTAELLGLPFLTPEAIGPTVPSSAWTSIRSLPLPLAQIIDVATPFGVVTALGILGMSVGLVRRGDGRGQRTAADPVRAPVTTTRDRRFPRARRIAGRGRRSPAPVPPAWSGPGRRCAGPRHTRPTEPAPPRKPRWWGRHRSSLR